VSAVQIDTRAIFAIERPSTKLMTLYLVRSILSGPLFFLLLPIFYFRYVSLRYRFDEEGVHMRWGVLFRREINLTYARIQDIHLRSGLLQRWFGLADVELQTASGSSSAEMTIEGLGEYEAIRDFLYSKMRGHEHAPGVATTSEGADLAAELRGIREELVRTREALERLGPSER